MAGDRPIGARRPVLVVTGSRAEFGLLEGTIEGLLGSKALEPRLVVSGMHLDAALGATARQVEARFVVAARVPMSPPEDSPGGMALAVAEGIRGFSAVLETENPSALLVLGDRIEPFAACIAAAYRGVPIAHIHGGDRSGNAIDDLHRDAISRMARLHLAATERSRRRLLSMGVEGSILVTGAPGLDAILAVPERPREAVLEDLGIPAGGPVLVVVQHPVPLAAAQAGAEAAQVLDAAAAFAQSRNGAVAVLYPNNDAGHLAVIAEIEERRANPRLRIFRSLPRETYIRLLAASGLLVGNSSSGIIESVSLGVAAVNVGRRQEGRERNPNVVDAEPRREAILEALERSQGDPEVRAALSSRANIYGDGRAAGRILQALEGFVT